MAAPSWIFQRFLFLSNAHTLQTQIDSLLQDGGPLAPPQAEFHHQKTRRNA